VLLRRGTVYGVGDKTLPPEMRARVIAAVEALIARYPGKSLRQVAELVGIDQPMLSTMRAGRSLGILALLKLRLATGRTLDDLLGLEPLGKPELAPPPPPAPDPADIIAEAIRRYEAQKASAPPPEPPPAPPAHRLRRRPQ
jgi:transcriptional regulator with XRE-family HTH domain